MAEYWIVTGKRPFEHATLKAAEQERERLFQEEPERRWRVIRCKRHVKSSENYGRVIALMTEIARDGLTPLHAARLTDLLSAIKARELAPAARDQAA